MASCPDTETAADNPAVTRPAALLLVSGYEVIVDLFAALVDNIRNNYQ